MLNTRALGTATVIGTALQLVMVIAGHTNDTIKLLFAVGGMSISLIAGLVYAKLAESRASGGLALGGSIAGGLCALLGICVSYYLRDVPALILAVGTLSSAVTGAVGAWVGRFIFGGARATV